MITVFLTIFLNTAFQQSDQSVLNEFLLSHDLHKSYIAFNTIILDENRFRDLVLTYLSDAESDKTKLNSRIIYLAAHFKDSRYIPFLVDIINDEEYSYESCIYSCPVVFALTIYEKFTNFKLANLDSSITPVQDLIAECDKVNQIKLIQTDVLLNMSGPGVNSALNKGIKLGNRELIEFAGPFKKDKNIPRFIAAAILSNRLIEPMFLPDLYWLAISEELDASMQYRSFIYPAIYKTESNKLFKFNN